MTPLMAQILNRRHSLFQRDLASRKKEVREAISGARLLVLGAAGSIGGAFVKAVLPFQPGALHLVDPSENNLVELVRDLRSSDLQPPSDFQTYAIGMGSRPFERFMETTKRFDFVVNFAAMKHVRSERDPFSLMRMVETNLLALRDLTEILFKQPPQHLFSVSSDKAVNPENAMGASKAFMEAILWSYADPIPASTARFANVAFSDGSLLFGFQKRLEKRQPLSAPTDVTRYFISHQEAGQLCLLACFAGANRSVFIPRLDPAANQRTFSEIAGLFLESRGYRPRLCDSEQEARAIAQTLTDNNREWPCFFSKSDTTGEKPFEAFSNADETVDFTNWHRIGVITKPPFQEAETLQRAFAALTHIRQSKNWQSREILAALKLMVPTLHHVEKARNLDQKM